MAGHSTRTVGRGAWAHYYGMQLAAVDVTGDCFRYKQRPSSGESAALDGGFEPAKLIIISR